MAGIIEVKDQGVLRIYDADNSNYVDIVVPSTVSSNRTITIPDATFTIPTSEFTSSTITGQSAETSVADDDLVVISDTSASGALKKMTKANFVGSTGKLLQVVHGSTTTQTANSSGTLADTTLTASITPSATSSKILVIVTHNSNYTNDADNNNALRIVLLRGSTEIGRTGAVGWIDATTDLITSSASFNVVDSPSSTSAQTYKTQFANINGGAAVYVQNSFGGAWAATSYITLMEIAG